MDESTSLKRCSVCGTAKPPTDFRRDRSTKDGLTYQCRECRQARDIDYRNRNAEAIRAKSIVRVARWREQNPGRAAEYSREWARANPEQAKAKARKWAAANRDKVAVHARTWREQNPEAARRQHAEQERRRRARLRAATVETVSPMLVWTGACALCGDSMQLDLPHPDPLSKSVDHIIPLAAGGAHSLENIQWAHLICNIRKGAQLSPLPN